MNPAQIGQLINENKMGDALKILLAIPDKTTWIQNALAVCYMRQGNAEKAVSVLLDAVYQKNSVVIKSGVADTTKLNLAAAMLLAGRVEGGLSVLNEVNHDLPMKKQLENAIQIWKKQQSIGSKILMALGVYPTQKPVILDFPPGQIEVDLKTEYFTR
ncbi:MAG: hypothetical protein ABFD91_17705 [Anaerohalosphaeraceae bacterium]